MHRPRIDWLKSDQAGNRSRDDVKRILQNEVLPAWGKLRITEIGKRHVLDLIDGVVDRGAVSLARRVHAHLHRLFRWSAGRDLSQIADRCPAAHGRQRIPVHHDGQNANFRMVTSQGETRPSHAARAGDGAKVKPQPWRIHDLRRTAATGMERLGVPLQVTEALLNHKAGSRAGVVGIYQPHKYEAEKREALEKWAQHVASLVSLGRGGPQ